MEAGEDHVTAGVFSLTRDIPLPVTASMKRNGTESISTLHKGQHPSSSTLTLGKNQNEQRQQLICLHSSVSNLSLIQEKLTAHLPSPQR